MRELHTSWDYQEGKTTRRLKSDACRYSQSQKKSKNVWIKDYFLLILNGLSILTKIRFSHLCQFIGTKESFCIIKEFSSQRTGLSGHFSGHQYGHHDVMWKQSISRYTDFLSKLIRKRNPWSGEWQQQQQFIRYIHTYYMALPK